MPYPTEHSARLEEPKKFKPDTYKRVDGGLLWGRVTVPKTIAIISAKLKDKCKPKDPYIAQSLRFPVKNWTSKEAKKWLKDNKVPYILFEPAEKSKDKQSEYQNTASQQACIFGQGCEVSFAEAGEQQEAGGFRILAYSGHVIRGHWLWGNLAIDLAGLKFDKKKTAVLENHFSDKRIGFTTMQDIADKVMVEGKFLSNPVAQQIKDDIAEGFPMQASLYVPPQLIEHVKEGESVEVNGQKLEGPGTVFRKATIKEVSMCALGADSQTQSKAFASEGNKQEVQFSVLEKEQIMDQQTSIAERPAETFASGRGGDKDDRPTGFWDAVEQRMKATQCSQADGVRFVVAERPELHEKMLRELNQPERTVPTAFWDKVGQHREKTGCNQGDAIRFCVEQYPELVGFWDAVQYHIREAKCGEAEAIRFCVKEFPELHNSFLAEQTEAAKATASKSGRPAAADVAGQPATWDAALKQQMTETNCSEADAVRFCVHKYPSLHEKMLEEQKLV